jgi:integrase/recombinase XerD
MGSDSQSLTFFKEPRTTAVTSLPRLIADVHPAGEFAWAEFFGGRIRNRPTRPAYLHAVRQFFVWAEETSTSLERITPSMVGAYFDHHRGSLPTKKLHLAALRAFFDILVNRHVIILNPAATVRGERYENVEGKTPEITRDQSSGAASIDRRVARGRTTR